MQSLKWQNWALGVLLSVCTACAGPTDGTDFEVGKSNRLQRIPRSLPPWMMGFQRVEPTDLNLDPMCLREPADSESAEDVGGG